MYKIKLLNNISASGTDRFPKNLYTISQDETNPDAILVRSASMHELDFPAELKAIARAGAGVNNIPIEACSEKGIVVFNTPGANANAVKELALAGLLLSSRKIVSGIEWAQSLKDCGKDVAKEVEKGKSSFVGPELMGKNLGIIGLGAIGVQLANVAVHLGMQVYGYDPYITVDGAWALSRSVFHASSLDEIFSECDYISIHVPSTNETKGLVKTESIEKMKDGVRIINLSRSDLVVSEDVKKATEKGKVACYVTDFPTEELLGVENIITIPHLGASTPESEDNCAKMAADELIDFLQHGNIQNSVNYPEVQLPFTGGVRICVFHKNIPSMLTQISSVLSDEKINIENMVNRSKKDNAYTLIETSNCPDTVSDKLSKITGVTRVRIIGQ